MTYLLVITLKILYLKFFNVVEFNDDMYIDISYIYLFFSYQVTYKADSLTLDFLKLAQNGNPMLSIIGEFEWQCRDIGPGMPLPYTSDGDSYMPVRHN